MEQQHKKPAPSTAASMSSAFLGVGVSSSTHSQSQAQLRRSSPSLYPPPAPLPGHLTSRGSAAASGGSASGLSSSSQFDQILPSPGPAAKRRPRPKSRLTHSLPSPFLSELISIRRMGANVFGDLNRQEIMSQRPLLHGQQEPGFAPPPLQQQQAQPSFSSLHPLPGGNFSGFPLPASQPQNMQPSSSSSSTDLPSRIFSGLEPPPAFQHFSTYLAPLPSGSTIFQSSSSSSEMYELPPFPESLQMPPLLLQQVKQDPVVVAPCLEPEIISLDDGDELSALVNSFASSHGHGSTSLPINLEDSIQLGGSGSGLSMRGAAEGGAQTWEAMLMPASVHDKVHNGSGSSRPTSASSSCDQSMGSSVAGTCQGWTDMLALANKIDMMSIGGSGCSTGPKMPRNYSSLPVENSTSVPAVPKLILGGMDRPGLPPRPRRGGTKGQYFSEPQMEAINKDNRLRELMKTDSKRVKRILCNREYTARLKAQKANHFQDLRRRADALKMDCRSLSAQVQSRQEMFDNLKTENRAVQIKLEGLKELDSLKQVLNHQLQSELQRLKS